MILDDIEDLQALQGTDEWRSRPYEAKQQLYQRLHKELREYTELSVPQRFALDQKLKSWTIDQKAPGPISRLTGTLDRGFDALMGLGQQFGRRVWPSEAATRQAEAAQGLPQGLGYALQGARQLVPFGLAEPAAEREYRLQQGPLEQTGLAPLGRVFGGAAQAAGSAFQAGAIEPAMGAVEAINRLFIGQHERGPWSPGRGLENVVGALTQVAGMAPRSFALGARGVGAIPPAAPRTGWTRPELATAQREAEAAARGARAIAEPPGRYRPPPESYLDLQAEAPMGQGELFPAPPPQPAFPGALANVPGQLPLPGVPPAPPPAPVAEYPRVWPGDVPLEAQPPWPGERVLSDRPAGPPFQRPGEVWPEGQVLQEPAPWPGELTLGGPPGAPAATIRGALPPIGGTSAPSAPGPVRSFQGGPAYNYFPLTDPTTQVRGPNIDVLRAPPGMALPPTRGALERPAAGRGGPTGWPGGMKLERPEGQPPPDLVRPETGAPPAAPPEPVTPPAAPAPPSVPAPVAVPAQKTGVRRPTAPRVTAAEVTPDTAQLIARLQEGTAAAEAAGEPSAESVIAAMQGKGKAPPTVNLKPPEPIALPGTVVEEPPPPPSAPSGRSLLKQTQGLGPGATGAPGAGPVGPPTPVGGTAAEVILPKGVIAEKPPLGQVSAWMQFPSGQRWRYDATGGMELWQEGAPPRRVFISKAVERELAKRGTVVTWEGGLATEGKPGPGTKMTTAPGLGGTQPPVPKKLSLQPKGEAPPPSLTEPAPSVVSAEGPIEGPIGAEEGPLVQAQKLVSPPDERALPSQPYMEQQLIPARGANPNPPDLGTTPYLDPANLPPTHLPGISWLQWMRKQVFEKLPRDWAVTDRIRGSPVITRSQQWIVDGANYTEQALTVNTEGYRKLLRESWPKGEQELANIFRQSVRDGMPVDLAKEAALNSPRLSEEGRLVAANVRWREAQFPLEDQAFGMLVDGGHLPEAQFPYLARRAEMNDERVVRLAAHPTNFAENLRTGLGAFELDRAETRGMTMAEANQVARATAQREGLKAGMAWEYTDAGRVSVHREVVGAWLRATAKYVTDLTNDGIIFRSLEEAQAAGAPRPTRFTFVPKTGEWGGPGTKAREWWARTPDEAKFIENQFVQTNSPMARAAYWANTLVRNYNLFNPIPHVARNMFYKYMLAGGNPGRLIFDVGEWARGTKMPGSNGLVDLFNEMMPHGSGQLAQSYVADALALRNPSQVAKTANTIFKASQAPPKMSAQFMFTKADPAMRYSLWKKYVAEYQKAGMDLRTAGQQAANEVTVDLINYNTRSETLNFWRSLPFNFFVPWRYGTIISIAKQFKNHPLRTGLIVASADYLRDVIYRQTGLFVHLPIDYLEGPMSEMIHEVMDAMLLRHQSPAEALKVGAIYGAKWAAASLTFGPGGGYSARQLEDAMRATFERDPESYKKLVGMWWGISQLVESGHDAAVMADRWSKGQEPTPKELSTLIIRATLAARAPVTFEPRRFVGEAERITDWLTGRQDSFSGAPGMEKTPDVQAADMLRGMRERARANRLDQREQQEAIEDEINQYLTDAEARMRILQRAAR